MEIGGVHRRESIIWNAIELIHECGIHSVSTKVISKRLGISEGTIFNHFSKKSDLLMAVLEQFSVYDSDIFRTAVSKESPKAAILFYIDAYASYYENYPAITALINANDVVWGVPELEDRSNTIFLTRFEHMKKLVEEAKAAGQISTETETDVAADIFTSTFRGICIRWRISKFEFSLRDKTMQAATMLLDAFSLKN